MSYLVINCFHWIGFHLVNNLLQNGHEVDGIDCQNSGSHDHLSMLVGRNSLFSLIRQEEQKRYHISIQVDSNFKSKLRTNYTLEMDHVKSSSHLHKDHLFIKLPLLFGNWMPMNERGMYYKNEFISFESERFLTEAVYIDDYIKELYKWLETIEVIEVGEGANNKQEKYKEIKEYTLPSINSSIQPQLEKTLAHYKRFYKLYK